ncbi:MAG: cytochrome c, partial [Acidobacteria bacterium]|nr:cytochrome c [Acidobacteriota bacterium]
MNVSWYRRTAAVCGVLLIGVASPAQAQPRPSESTGVSQYFVNCASCHEAVDGHAPKTGVLKQMTPERILESLTTGTMRTQAANVSETDRVLIAEWLGGRKLDLGLAGAAEKMPNVCSAHPPVSNLGAPGWNGWGVDLVNSRRQTAAAAGLSPGQVSRLELKWAFGMPGATALYELAEKLDLIVDRQGRVGVLRSAACVEMTASPTRCSATSRPS